MPEALDLAQPWRSQLTIWFQLVKIWVTSLKWVVGDNAVVAVEIDAMRPPRASPRTS